jgi:hypothetical protein
LKEGDVIALDVTDEVQEGLKIDPQFPKTGNQQPGSQSEQKPGQGGNYGSQGLTDQPQSKSKGGGGKGGGSHSSNSGK